MEKEMSPEETEALMQQASVGGAVGQQAQIAAQQQYYIQEQEKNLAETQLEVESVTLKIHHLLRQDVEKLTPDGRLEWQDLSDQKQRALTDWGVDRIMQTIHFYINKNTLLSNFNEKQIDRIMLRFCIELNDLVLLKYQLLFRQPSFEECKVILKERMEEHKKIKKYSKEILGQEVNEKEIEEEVIKEVENRIEYELNKIREGQRKEKLREYGLLMAQLEAMVLATYNRAWRGEERGSIRRHTNISEIIGGRPQTQKGEGGMFKWIKS